MALKDNLVEEVGQIQDLVRTVHRGVEKGLIDKNSGLEKLVLIYKRLESLKNQINKF